ncbi:MAG: GspL/Epsl periplasmic domain-containing protein [Mariprofundus sp.]|nr:GspL/Epsl periplasmic domain-containing protein [Mariprofundus sp.]
MMDDMEPRTLRVSFDGTDWLATDVDGNTFTLTAGDEVALPEIAFPELPDTAVVSTVLLPVEHLLSRSFSLPLAQTRFIDQEILGQELEEHSSEQAEDWWLAWQGGSAGDGVAGMMFGLPETVRKQIDAYEGWRQASYIGVDIWVRLNASLEASPKAKQFENAVAVLDADVSGICFGVWSGGDGSQTAGGFWHGMRRLNWGAALLEHQCTELAENILRSLQAMGWEGDGGMAVGRLPVVLQKALNLSSWQGESAELSELPGRNEANLAVDAASGLNFRHGRWRAESPLGNLKPWRRTLAMAVALTVIWATGMMWQNHRLNVQLKEAQQRIVTAFHTGLPNEAVMIDAMAQLRKAAGGRSTGASGHDATMWLRQIAAVHRVYQQTPWKIRELSFRDGIMTMSGWATDLQTMNRIREALQKQTGKKVKLLDTDLSGNRVKFRMTWS